MDNNRSRLPRAASNPAIRPASTSGTSTTTSRLPPPSRLLHRSSTLTLSRKPSVPLRSAGLARKGGTTINAAQQTGDSKSLGQPVLASPHPFTAAPSSTRNSGTFSNLASRSPPKRLLPSRSTLGLSRAVKSSNTAPSVQARTAQPLAPKRIILSARPFTSLSSREALYPLLPSSVSKHINHFHRSIERRPPNVQQRDALYPTEKALKLTPPSQYKPVSHSPTIVRSKAEDGLLQPSLTTPSCAVSEIKREWDVSECRSAKGMDVSVGSTQNVTERDTSLFQSDSAKSLSTPLLPYIMSRPPYSSTGLQSRTQDSAQLEDTELSFVIEEGDSSDDLSSLCLIPGSDSRSGSSFELDLGEGKSRFPISSTAEEYEPGGRQAAQMLSANTTSVQAHLGAPSKDCGDTKEEPPVEYQKKLKELEDEIEKLRMERGDMAQIAQAGSEQVAMLKRARDEGIAQAWGEAARTGQEILEELGDFRALLRDMMRDSEDST